VGLSLPVGSRIRPGFADQRSDFGGVLVRP
jgi:hypothetical protein